eukprot:gene29176-35212_t
MLSALSLAQKEFSSVTLDSFAEADEKILREFGVPISNQKLSAQDYFRVFDDNDTLITSPTPALVPTPALTPSSPPSGTPVVSDGPGSDVDAPLFDAADYQNLFYANAYAYSHITQYVGLDHTAEYASSIAISADYIVVGSNGYDNFTGIVHVYQAFNETAFKLLGYIRAPPGSNMNFGISCDVFGQRIVVGANSDKYFTGGVYVYSLYEGTNWQLEEYLYSPGGPTTGFGRSVAMFGNNLVAGTGVGKAYIYERRARGWRMSATLSIGNDVASAFGRQVDIYGDFVVTGAPRSLNSHGAVHIYRRISFGDWREVAVLPSQTGYNSFFGNSVAIHNTTLAVGAPGYQANIWWTAKNIDWSQNPENTGWVYIYERDLSVADGSKWDLVVSLKSPIGMNSYFGQSVSLNSYYLGVGADGYPNGDCKGAALLYTRVSRTFYNLTIAFPSPADHNEYFGRAISVSENYNLVVGAFAFSQLRGALYFMPLPKPSFPSGTGGGTSSIISQPSSAEEAVTLSVIGILIVMLLLVLTVAAVAYSCGANCCCVAIVPAGGKKKKKKEEEDSPYTVHSYVGYSELDDNYSYNSSSLPSMPHHHPPPLPRPTSFVPPPP